MYDAAILKAFKPLESRYLKTGNKFPKIKTTDIYGNKINTKSLLGKIIVINYWFINCGQCRAEIPFLNKIVDKFKNDSSIVFISIALDEEYQLKEFIKSNPFKYQIIDKGQFLTDKSQIKAFPTNVVVDKKGRVYYNSTGFSPSTPIWIEKSINELKEIPF